MDLVAQLLADLQAGAIAAEDLATRIAALSDEQLAEFETLAAELFDSIKAGETQVEGSVVELLTRITDAVDAVRADADRRMAEALDELAQIAELENRIRPVVDETVPGEGDGEDGDGENGADDGENAEGEDGGDEDVPVVEPEDAEAKVPVAAGARAVNAPTIQRLAARAAQANKPKPASQSNDTPKTTIIAGAELRDYTAGAEIKGVDKLADAIMLRSDALRRGRGTQSLHVASIVASYPEDRKLGADAARNESLIASVMDKDAGGPAKSLTAAGGPCAPAANLYEQMSIAEDARPFRDSLNAFQASRSGVVVFPSPDWTAYSAGVSIWTQENDEDATDDDNIRKPCVRVDCDEAITYRTYAIPVCVTVGNWFERAFPERLAAITSGIGAWQARFAERALLDILATLSDTASTTQVLGAARDILTVLDVKVAAFRDVERVSDTYTLRLAIPRWVRALIRQDLTRSLPFNTAEESLAIADAVIDAFFERRNVIVTWLWDAENGSGQELDVNYYTGDGADFPDTVVGYLYHPNAIGLLDEGRIDLGVQRDSTLNAANDMQLWGETFEGLFYRGVRKPLRLSMALCPTGEVAATADISALVCTGS